jgi:YVTN family beta-propeller protein
VTDL